MSRFSDGRLCVMALWCHVGTYNFVKEPAEPLNPRAGRVSVVSVICNPILGALQSHRLFVAGEPNPPPLGSWHRNVKDARFTRVQRSAETVPVGRCATQ